MGTTKSKIDNSPLLLKDPVIYTFKCSFDHLIAWEEFLRKCVSMGRFFRLSKEIVPFGVYKLKRNESKDKFILKCSICPLGSEFTNNDNVDVCFVCDALNSARLKCQVRIINECTGFKSSLMDMEHLNDLQYLDMDLSWDEFITRFCVYDDNSVRVTFELLVSPFDHTTHPSTISLPIAPDFSCIPLEHSSFVTIHKQC